ncbi:hypothetical protein LXL04_000973 [Taraxacum kok-saghyz]
MWHVMWQKMGVEGLDPYHIALLYIHHVFSASLLISSNNVRLRSHEDELNNWILNTGKSSWPELVGLTGGEAERRIETENSRVNATVLLDGTPTTKDFRCDRVWVWVNSSGVVIRAPRIG